MNPKQKLTADEAREIRAKFGLTQSEMDARLGVGKGSYRDYERARRPMPAPTGKLLQILLALRDAKRTAASAVYSAFWG